MSQTTVLPNISLSMKNPLAQLGMAELEFHGVVVWNQKDQMNIVPVEDEFDEIDEIEAVLGDMSVHLVQ